MTSRALLVSPVRAVAAAAAVLALSALLASCGDGEEEFGPDTRPSAVTSASPIPATATPLGTAGRTSAPVPSGWQRYVDPVLGFSFEYPPNLIPTVLPTSNSGLKQRVTDFRPVGAKEPGLAVVVVEDVGDISLRDWVQTYSMCNLSVRPGTDVTIGGRAGVVCVGEPMDGQFDHEIIIKDGNRIIYISTTLADSDFGLVVSSMIFPG